MWGLGLWGLTPLSTIFQLYRVDLFYLWKTRRKPPTWQTLSGCIGYTSPWLGFELTTLVVIGVDCTGSCKSNYHMITTMMAKKNTRSYLHNFCVKKTWDLQRYTFFIVTITLIFQIDIKWGYTCFHILLRKLLHWNLYWWYWS